MQDQRTLLIVDDDEGICRLLSATLRRQGFTAEWRLSGEAARERLREGGIALMALDLYLPDMNGQELVKILSEEGCLPPYIVISGMDDVRVAVQLMQLGALDFLTKDTQLPALVVPVVARCFQRLEQEMRLKETETRFLQLATNIESLFWIASPDLKKFIYLSPAYERIWGRPVSAVYENPRAWREAVLSMDLPVLEQAGKRLASLGGNMEIEFRIVRPDGGVRWLLSTAFPLFDSKGEVERLTGFVHDITERKEMSRRLLEAADQERRRIGADLHDDLCQRLAAVKLQTGLLERQLLAEGNGLAEMAGELVSAVGDATTLARSLAQGLAPVLLDAEGLVPALNNLARLATRIFGIPVSFETFDGTARLDPETANHLYRIAQELISNAAKHACPARITVRLSRNPGCLSLVVSNDGKPFSAGHGSGGGGGHGHAGSGMGLHLIRLRTEAMGATLEFYPAPEPGGGTRAVCRIPNNLPVHEK